MGLKGRESYLEPQILAAYEELASTVVEEGYSSRVQDGKLRMLEQAADEVRLQSSTGIDSEIQVQWDDLPGALALLQEVCIIFLHKLACSYAVLLLASVWLGWAHCHGTRKTHCLEGPSRKH